MRLHPLSCHQNRFLFALLVALGLLMTTTTLAVTVADVTLPDSAEVDGQPLVLNGAGLRTKFFIKVYAAALYLPAKMRDAEAIITSAGPKRVIMHFIYDEVAREKLTDGWSDGFENNLSEADFERLKPKLDAFNALFTTVHEGDRIVLDFSRDGSVRVTLRGEQHGSVTGRDFQQALLRVWLGEEPADWDLREAMLGGD